MHRLAHVDSIPAVPWDPRISFKFVQQNGCLVPIGLHTAVSHGLVDKVEELIQSMKDKKEIDAVNRSNWTPLMFAAVHYKNPAVINLLLRNSASSCMKNSDGHTALMLAIMCKQHEAAAILIQSGADIEVTNNEGWTALFFAISFEHLDTLKLLLEKNCNLDIRDKKNRTPLSLAHETKNSSILNEVLKYVPESMANEKHNMASTSAKEECHSLESVCEILENLNISKYYEIFEKNNITTSQFWNLKDEDLIEMGIKLLGPRKKITNAIKSRQEMVKLSDVP